MKDETKIVVSGRNPEDNFGIVNPPVYHASTVLYSSLAELQQAHRDRAEGKQVVTYGRIGTPTSWSLENAVADLEGGYRTQVFPSGLAACSFAIQAFVKSGDHILVTDSVYNPTRQFCETVLKKFGVQTTYYDPLIGKGIAELIQDNTTVIFTESPGSQTFEMQDIPAIAEIAHQHGAVVIMDNTWASPLFYKPFEHGVDVSIQAGTKYIVGHSDVMIGTVTTTEKHWPALQAAANQMGQTSGPDDVYLAQRGLRTLSVRLKQHMENAIKIAKWLEDRPEVHSVLHPALESHPQHDLWKRDFLGASGLFSFRLKACSKEAMAAFLDNLELFGMGYSWGGYESLIIYADPSSYRTATTWDNSNPLIRVHIGLEDPEDLMADLSAGFEKLAAAS
ncbi:cystathionine beta-lyase [Sneathiella limimaris]|uniref:cystathionine beta-lyase n=1 Tax=Sneathiella limimaris TaxID=1964213 RepID=UPI00146DBDB3|nr:cystathionine beta-lyase [Sneathiella limimaris]